MYYVKHFDVFPVWYNTSNLKAWVVCIHVYPPTVFIQKFHHVVSFFFLVWAHNVLSSLTWLFMLYPSLVTVIHKGCRCYFQNELQNKSNYAQLNIPASSLTCQYWYVTLCFFKAGLHMLLTCSMIYSLTVIGWNANMLYQCESLITAAVWSIVLHISCFTLNWSWK